MPNVIRVTSWEECEKQIKEIEGAHESITGVCFRGQSNSEWPLNSTLERHVCADESVLEYYRMIGVIRPTIETFTGSSWELPSYQDMAELTGEYDTFSRKLQFEMHNLGYSFLAHLRHQGFPSPLLDWSESPYVAAYFAFAHAGKSDHAAIFLYVESPQNMKGRGSSEPAIYGLGPIVKTHKRHFRQQSRYTVCVEFNSTSGWKFVPHQKVFDLGRSDQDLLWKIEIPITERIKVLRLLNRFNINAFSLFDSEESLMETLACRYLDLNPLKSGAST
jgi:hypothetical protein